MRFLIIATLALLFSCKSPCVATFETDTSQQKEIAFNIIKEGTNSGFTEFGKYFIAKQSGLSIIWDSIYVNYMQKDPIPEIDFEENEVYLIAMGEKNSGGYTIKVESVIETKKEIIVNVVKSKPGKTCMTTSVMTYPYQLFTIPKPNKSLRFNWIEKVYECEK
jgi:hypothetical protein